MPTYSYMYLLLISFFLFPYQLNPQHSIPVLNDNGKYFPGVKKNSNAKSTHYLITLGFIVNESRPIATYLCNKYGKDDKLYPKDSAVRATVDARLYFDMGTFYKTFMDFVVITINFSPF